MSSTCCNFLVYGTLRDDDNSGATWTEEFIAGRQSAKTAHVSGYQLYKNTRDNWPYALKTGNPEDRITVRVVTFSNTVIDAKQVEADIIEQVDAVNSTYKYERTLATAICVDDNSSVHGHLYFIAELPANLTWAPIVSNDWLQRDV